MAIRTSANMPPSDFKAEPLPQMTQSMRMAKSSSSSNSEMQSISAMNSKMQTIMSD